VDSSFRVRSVSPNKMQCEPLIVLKSFMFVKNIEANNVGDDRTVGRPGHVSHPATKCLPSARDLSVSAIGDLSPINFFVETLEYAKRL